VDAVYFLVPICTFILAFLVLGVDLPVKSDYLHDLLRDSILMIMGLSGVIVAVLGLIKIDDPSLVLKFVLGCLIPGNLIFPAIPLFTRWEDRKSGAIE
jgi:hypothetical protein